MAPEVVMQPTSFSLFIFSCCALSSDYRICSLFWCYLLDLYRLRSSVHVVCEENLLPLGMYVQNVIIQLAHIGAVIWCASCCRILLAVH